MLDTLALIASICFLAANIIDAVSTYIILKDGGTEHNPFMRWLIDAVGLAGGCFAKIALGLVIIGVLNAVNPLVATVVLGLGTVGYAVVLVRYNLRAL